MKFTKMHGLGNDYIYIDCTKEKEPSNIAQLTKAISNRHFGIGADGVILILPSEIADFKMKMFNSDGTQAQMCGNGIRCVGKFVYDKGLTRKETIQIETLAGIKTLELNIKNSRVDTVKVDMGESILEPEKIPVLSDKNTDIILNSFDKTLNFTCVSMGNPHAVTIIEDIQNLDIVKYGKDLENNKIFPQKANIEFIEIIDRNNIKMRVWERGTGETLACGTGACAAVVATNIKDLTNNEVNVELAGGKLRIKWDKQNNHIYMLGAAVTVFEGEIKEEEYEFS